MNNGTKVLIISIVAFIIILFAVVGGVVKLGKSQQQYKLTDYSCDYIENALLGGAKVPANCGGVFCSAYEVSEVMASYQLRCINKKEMILPSCEESPQSIKPVDKGPACPQVEVGGVLHDNCGFPCDKLNDSQRCCCMVRKQP